MKINLHKLASRRLPILAAVLVLSMVGVACSGAGLLPLGGVTTGVHAPASTVKDVPAAVDPDQVLDAPAAASDIEVAPATVSPDAEEQLLNSIYTAAAPAVVHIRVAANVPVDVPQGFHVPNDFLRRGQGSGFVIDKEGHIVTNNHVVQDAVEVEVTFFDGLTARAEVVGTDPDSDVAVIQVDINPTLLHPIELADSDEVFVGQRAIALGNPFGQTWTLTAGIVSAVGRTIQSSASQFSIPEVIQTDAAINPGNSGGPLLDSEGRVIGVNTMILSESGSSSGVGFAVPINIVRQVVPTLIAGEDYAYPFLGISGTNLSLEVIEAMGLDVTQRGALVVEVLPDGPAAAAGLRGAANTAVPNSQEIPTGGDIIVGFEGKEVSTMDDLITYLVDEYRPDDVVTLTILRDGAEMDVEVTLGTRP